MFWWIVTIVTVALGLRPEHSMEDVPLPCNDRTQVVPAKMSQTFHLMQICDVAFSQCNTAVAYDPYLNQYAACQKMTRLHPTQGTPVGLCIVAEWAVSNIQRWVQRTKSSYCPTVLPAGKGPIAEDVRQRIKDHQEKCKVELCGVATTGKWSTWTKAASKKPWPMSSWKPTETGWAKMSRNLCGGHDLAGIQLYDVDRLKALVTKDGETKFNKNICGCKEDDCSEFYVKMR